MCENTHYLCYWNKNVPVSIWLYCRILFYNIYPLLLYFNIVWPWLTLNETMFGNSADIDDALMYKRDYVSFCVAYDEKVCPTDDWEVWMLMNIFSVIKCFSWFFSCCFVFHCRSNSCTRSIYLHTLQTITDIHKAPMWKTKKSEISLSSPPVCFFHYLKTI